MQRRLIVTADDVGLDAGMTAGAIAAHRDGIVTACSIVANGVAFDDAVDRLRDVPHLEAGVHLTLVEERPLTAMRFPRKYTSFLPLYLARRISMDAIERELRAQIERVLATGLRVTHLNSHQHLHALPRLFALTTRLAAEYGFGYVRVPSDARVTLYSPRTIAVWALGTIARRAAGSASPGTIGITESGHLTSADIIELLDYLPEGVTELVTHPGIGVGGYGHWHYDWDAETAALCDAEVADVIRSRDVTLVAPSALL